MESITESSLSDLKKDLDERIKYLDELKRDYYKQREMLSKEMSIISSGEYDDYDYAFEYKINIECAEEDYEKQLAFAKREYANFLFKKAYRDLVIAQNDFYAAKYYKDLLEIEYNSSLTIEVPEIDLLKRLFEEYSQKSNLVKFEEYLRNNERE